jgi:hypothetical protein
VLATAASNGGPDRAGLGYKAAAGPWPLPDTNDASRTRSHGEIKSAKTARLAETGNRGCLAELRLTLPLVARWLSRFGGNRRARLDDQLSRMMRESQVRFCERLGVKFPGPTRRVSRGSRVQTAMRNCTRDEGRSFEVGAAGVALRSHPSGYPPEYFVFG